MVENLEMPFHSIENAQEYMVLLAEMISETREDIENQIAGTNPKFARQLDALRLVLFNLNKLDGHIRGSRRALNDLRALRRLIIQEPQDQTAD
jgi:hypothetical protein